MPTLKNFPMDMDKEGFRAIGHQLIDDISDFLDTIRSRPVTYNRSPSEIQHKLGTSPLPNMGTPASEVLSRATELLFDNSLFNGHPKFLGYITSSAAPLGVLAELLAASVNPNVGAYQLSPVATEIEKQTIQWLAEFIGLSPSYGGILVSGGNMANFTAFLAAQNAKSPESLKTEGMRSINRKQTVYCSKTTHTWIEKAASLFGLGAEAVRWVPADASNRINLDSLAKTIAQDMEDGCQPLMVVGTAGDVSTGAVDDLEGIGHICQSFNTWFHIDGAYGIPAAVVPKYKGLFTGLEQADSIALDPHKWLYSPLEAGCTLVKNPKHLTDTFSSHPEYYHFRGQEGEFAQNYYEYGLQNSRGFRALKVWLALQHLGRSGYQERIAGDIALAKLFYDLANEHAETEAVSQHLSITTLRYIPVGCASGSKKDEDYLNALNKNLLEELQHSGEAFLSNAIVHGKFCLRGCIVNFRTSNRDIEEILEVIIKIGRKIHLDRSPDV